MNSEWQLRMLKLLVNVPLRLLNRVLQFPEPKYLQTKMLQHTYQIMLKTYRLEVQKGVFDVPDGNFERFLMVAAKLAANIGERDPLGMARADLLACRRRT